jgi:hypothetical protein
MDVILSVNAAPTRDGEGFAGQLLADPIEINSVTRL